MTPTAPADLAELERKCAGLRPDAFVEVFMPQLQELIAAARQMPALQAEVERLTSLIADYEEALASKRENIRMIDVAMHGEEGAAKQASGCDLIDPARRLRERAEKAEAEAENLRAENLALFTAVDTIGSGYYFPKDAPKILDEFVDLARSTTAGLATAIERMKADQQRALIEADETGYGRGLDDGLEDASRRAAALPAPAQAGPVAWRFELASWVDENGDPTIWEKPQLSFTPPNAGKQQRNVTPLYAAPPPPAAKE